jgi:hypothetical protein
MNNNLIFWILSILAILIGTGIVLYYFIPLPFVLKGDKK